MVCITIMLFFVSAIFVARNHIYIKAFKETEYDRSF